MPFVGTRGDQTGISSRAALPPATALTGTPSVEHRKFFAPRDGKAQEVCVSDLRLIYERTGQEQVDDAHVLRPELMSRCRTQAYQYREDGHRISRTVRVVRMAHDANEAVLGNGTSRPWRWTGAGIPGTRLLMMNMHWVRQGQKQVNVEEIAQGSSSRSRLTISNVTGPAPGCTGIKGKPSSAVRGMSRLSASRARSETTFPAVVRRRLAISLAALKISSSMSIVVRISHLMLTHHRCGRPPQTPLIPVVERRQRAEWRVDFYR